MSQLNIALVARVKQGDLWEALQKRGWSQTAGAKFIGMNPYAFGDMINLRAVPNLTMEQECKLFELTGKTLEEIFPSEIRTKEFLQGQRVFSALKKCSVAALASSGIRALPMNQPEMVEELAEEIRACISFLSGRERDVMSLVNKGKSDQEIGVKLSLSVYQVIRSKTHASDKIKEIIKQKRPDLKGY